MKRVPTEIRRVWVVTFELEDIARLGGLGVAVRRHVDILSRRGLEVRVFMPSHGRHFSREHVERYGLRLVEDFRCCGHRTGVDGREYRYCIGVYEGRAGRVDLRLFIGLDRETGSILDRWGIYEGLPEKVSLLIRGLRCWLDYSGERPDLLIGHDWHGGLVASAVRIYLEREGLYTPYLYFIHLLSGPSFPYHYVSPQWSGLPEGSTRVWRVWRHETVDIRGLWDSYRGDTDLFNIDIADTVASVSHGYLQEVVRRSGEWVLPKTCVVYNSTDWRVESVRDFLRERYGTDDRCRLRWRFYRDTIALARPCIGHIEPGGMLVLSGGRTTWQKGFDTLARSLEYLDDRFRVLVLGIGVGDHSYERYLRELSDRFYGRFLVTCDNIEKRVYQSYVYLANVFVAPSRYEPFGLSSIEAQAVGTPVAASRIPGLSETLRDIRTDPAGTGMFSEPEDPRDLAVAIKTLALLTEAIDCGDHSLLQEIPDPVVREQALSQRHLVYRLRENCIENIERSFREYNTEKMLVECIEKCRTYAYYRSLG